MKPSPGILYLIDGTVKCAEREKPELKETTTQVGNLLFHKAYKSWLESCKDVVNAHVSQHPIEGHDEITIMKPVYQIVESGQKVLKVPEGDKVRIVELK